MDRFGATIDPRRRPAQDRRGRAGRTAARRRRRLRSRRPRAISARQPFSRARTCNHDIDRRTAAPHRHHPRGQPPKAGVALRQAVRADDQPALRCAGVPGRAARGCARHRAPPGRARHRRGQRRRVLQDQLPVLRHRAARRHRADHAEVRPSGHARDEIVPDLLSRRLAFRHAADPLRLHRADPLHRAGAARHRSGEPQGAPSPAPGGSTRSCRRCRRRAASA